MITIEEVAISVVLAIVFLIIVVSVVVVMIDRFRHNPNLNCRDIKYTFRARLIDRRFRIHDDIPLDELIKLILDEYNIVIEQRGDGEFYVKYSMGDSDE